MRYHYDTEFKDTGSTIEPISLGMVDDNGRELYMIHIPTVRAFQEREYFNKLDQTDLWLRDNVFNYITEQDLEDYGHTNKDSMAVELYNFVTDIDWSVGNSIELWGYFAAYDHVLLSQLFGRMIDLPGSMPMFTNELMTIRKRSNGTWKPKPVRPVELPEHHALMDAKYQKLMYEAWS